ncbi:hypothetical protein D9M72_593740 [compost metagenome]
MDALMIEPALSPSLTAVAFREWLKEARIAAVSFLLGITSLSAIPGFSELVYSIRNLRRF